MVEDFDAYMVLDYALPIVFEYIRLPTNAVGDDDLVSFFQ